MANSISLVGLSHRGHKIADIHLSTHNLVARTGRPLVRVSSGTRRGCPRSTFPGPAISPHPYFLGTIVIGSFAINDPLSRQIMSSVHIKPCCYVPVLTLQNVRASACGGFAVANLRSAVFELMRGSSEHIRTTDFNPFILAGWKYCSCTH